MTYAHLVRAISGRPERKGISTAFGSLHDLQSCLDGTGSCPWKMLNGTTERQWRRVLKESKRRLVYQDDDMGIDKDSFTKEFKDVAVREMPPHGIALMNIRTTSTKKDRDGDVLESGGAEVDALGPVLFNHMPFETIGRLIRVIKKTPKFLDERIALVDTPMGNDMLKLAEFGALRISHGFIPKEWEPLDAKDPRGGFRIKQFEIMERSLVSVPSNTDAIIQLIDKQKLFSPIVKSWAKSFYDARPSQGIGMDLNTKCKGGSGGSRCSGGEGCTCGGSDKKAADRDEEDAADGGKDEASECPDCGATLKDGKCPKCGYSDEGMMSGGNKSGAPLEICPECGGEMDDDECMDCGWVDQNQKASKAPGRGPGELDNGIMTNEMCPECGTAMEDNKCPNCGYTLKGEKQAEEPAKPIKMESDAPNYRESVRLDQGCGNCAFRKDFMCSKHQFLIHGDSICDDYAQEGSMAAATPPNKTSATIGNAKTGRVLNAANEHKLREAHADLDALLKIDGLSRQHTVFAQLAKDAIDAVLGAVAKTEHSEPDVVGAGGKSASESWTAEEIVNQLAARVIASGDASEIKSVHDRLAVLLAGHEQRTQEKDFDSLLRDLSLGV